MYCYHCCLFILSICCIIHSLESYSKVCCHLCKASFLITVSFILIHPFLPCFILRRWHLLGYLAHFWFDHPISQAVMRSNGWRAFFCCMESTSDPLIFVRQQMALNTVHLWINSQDCSGLLGLYGCHIYGLSWCLCILIVICILTAVWRPFGDTAGSSTPGINSFAACLCWAWLGAAQIWDDNWCGNHWLNAGTATITAAYQVTKQLL